MWNGYADGHRGLVLEFGCLDEIDSAWLMAKPVKYSDQPLRSNTAAGFAELLFYTPEFGVKKILEEYTHTKTLDWAHEKEWRVASWKRLHEKGDFSDYPFAQEELQEITFGALIASEDKEYLWNLIKSRYPSAKVWQAAIEGGRRLTRKTLD